MNLLQSLGALAWSPVFIGFFVLCGLYFTVGSRFLPLRLIKWGRGTIGTLGVQKPEKDGSVSQFQAVSAALGGALGTGNIVGISSAIALGGAGSVFWMWVSALFGMALAFAEKALTIRTRIRKKDGSFSGGAMFYIEKALGRPVAKGFCVLALFCCVATGCMAQANAITDTVCSSLPVSPALLGGAVSVLAFAVISGGIKRIAGVCEFLIPFLTVIYILAGVFVLFINRSLLFGAIEEIFSSAFTLKAASGGGMFVAMRYGFARGIFSNEAGVGSSTIPHASADAPSAFSQGLWGIFEVFLDTILVCTITALVIVSSPFRSSALEGAALTEAAFSSLFGRASPYFIGSVVFLFAFSTIISRSFCAEENLSYILGKSSRKGLIRLSLCAFCFLGSVLSARAVWELADVFNAVMAIPNLISLLILSPTVFREARAG